MMKRYVIERDIPGAGSLSKEELTDIATKSCDAIQALNNNVQWNYTYVANDKTYCVYLAESPDDIRAHAAKAGFPVNNIQEIKTILDPTNAKIGVPVHS